MTKIITIEFYTVGFFDFEKIEDRVTTNKTLSSSGGRILHPKPCLQNPDFEPPKKPVEKKRSSVKRPGIQDEAVAVTADGTPGHKMSGNPGVGSMVGDLKNDFDLRSLTWIFHIWGFPKIMVPPNHLF